MGSLPPASPLACGKAAPATAGCGLPQLREQGSMPRSPPAQRRVQSSMRGDRRRLFPESFASLDERTSLVLSRFFSFLVCFFKECGFLSPSAIWPHQEHCQTKSAPSYTARSSRPSKAAEVERPVPADRRPGPAGARGGPGGPTNTPRLSSTPVPTEHAPQARLGAASRSPPHAHAEPGCVCFLPVAEV